MDKKYLGSDPDFEYFEQQGNIYIKKSPDIEYRKRACPSFKLSWASIGGSILFLATCIILETFYRTYLFDFSISVDGIPAWQKHFTETDMNAVAVFSNLGGSKELLALLVIGFIFQTREKYFYFLVVYTLDKLYVGYFKLLYA